MYDGDPGKSDLIDEDEVEEEEEDEIEVGSENGEMMVGDFGVVDLRREMGDGIDAPLSNNVDLDGLTDRRLDLSGSASRSNDVPLHNNVDLSGLTNRRLDLSVSANHRVAEMNDLFHRRRGFDEPEIGNGLDLSRVTLESGMNAEHLSKDHNLTQTPTPVHTSRRIQAASDRLKCTPVLSTPGDDSDDDDDDDIDLENDDEDDDVTMGDGENNAIHRVLLERSRDHSSDPVVSTCSSVFTAKGRDKNGNEEAKGVNVDRDSSDDNVDVN